MIKLKDILDENYSHIRYLVADLNDLYYSVNDEKLKKIIMDLIPNGNQYKYTPEKADFYIKKFEELEKMSNKVLKSNNPIGRRLEKIVKGGLEFWNQKGINELSNTGLDSPIIKLVFWDEKNGLKDEKKVKEILRVLERNLKIVRPGYKFDPNDIMDSFKYFEATDKLIGNYPKFIFFNQQARRSSTYAVNMNNCRFKDELLKISKTLNVKRKTV